MKIHAPKHSGYGGRRSASPVATTETQIVKRLTSLSIACNGSSRTLVSTIYALLIPKGSWSIRDSPRSAMKRILKRVRKKGRQPFRRQKRGPLRAKAAGKNEVRPRCR